MPTKIIADSIGYDLTRTFDAGPGADTFDLTSGGDTLAEYSAGTVLRINGGTPAAGASAEKPYTTPAADDTVKLPGAASDYSYLVQFGSSSTTTHTFVTRATATSLGAKPLVSVDTVNIQRVSFANNAIVNQVSATFGSLLTEAAKLSDEVYGPLVGMHASEALASDPTRILSQTLNVGDAAVARGWHEVSALELAMPAANFGPAGALQYAFANGLYQAIFATDRPSLAATTESNAQVLTGVVNGKSTLSITFRGTDQLSDYADYLDFRAHQYKAFRPLIDALKTYVATHAVDQILVSGHSMGGALAQLFAQEMPADKVRVVTFGSPGAEAGSTAPQLNFVHNNDPVATLAPVASSLSDLGKAAAEASLIVAFGPYLGATAGDIVQNMQPKARVGSEVLLNSDIPISFPPFGQHKAAGYITDVGKLVQYARDTASPFSLTSFAQAIRTDIITALPVPRIASGNGSLSGGTMQTDPGDEYVLGDRGANDSVLWNGAVQAGNTVRVIDGGGHSLGGHDMLVLPNYDAVAGWSWTRSGDHFDLSKYGIKTAELYRIDDVVFANYGGDSDPISLSVLAAATAATSVAAFDPTSVLVHLDGRPTSMLTAPSGATTLVDNGTNDVVYAGGGVTQVNSTIDARVVVYAQDTSRVNVSGHGSVVESTGLPNPGTVVIDTGVGDTTVVAGKGTDTFIGRLYGARLNGGGGLNTVDFSAAAEALVIDLAAGLASGNSGDEWLQNIQKAIGSATATNVITAGPTGAIMIGGAADDLFILAGGIDIVTTKGGHDILRGTLANTAGDAILDLNSDDQIEITDASPQSRIDFDATSSRLTITDTSGRSSALTIAVAAPQTARFSIGASSDGHAVVKLVAGTGSGVPTSPNTVNPTGTTPSPTTTTSGGSSSTTPGTATPVTPGVLSVYRFFDTHNGTHFLTASAAERASILATRPDLKDEGVGLTAVNPASSDKNAAPVYRFFDTKFGTHFFTASTAERDTVIRTRPDLTYEKDGIFYEHLTKQAGDVPVFRFFDAVRGTHFYTANLSEATDILTSRLDLKNEGIGFYAPGQT